MPKNKGAFYELGRVVHGFNFSTSMTESDVACAILEAFPVLGSLTKVT